MIHSLSCWIDSDCCTQLSQYDRTIDYLPAAGTAGGEATEQTESAWIIGITTRAYQRKDICIAKIINGLTLPVATNLPARVL